MEKVRILQNMAKKILLLGKDNKKDEMSGEKPGSRRSRSRSLKIFKSSKDEDELIGEKLANNQYSVSLADFINLYHLQQLEPDGHQEEEDEGAGCNWDPQHVPPRRRQGQPQPKQFKKKYHSCKERGERLDLPPVFFDILPPPSLSRPASTGSFSPCSPPPSESSDYYSAIYPPPEFIRPGLPPSTSSSTASSSSPSVTSRMRFSQEDEEEEEEEDEGLTGDSRLTPSEEANNNSSRRKFILTIDTTANDTAANSSTRPHNHHPRRLVRSTSRGQNCAEILRAKTISFADLPIYQTPPPESSIPIPQARAWHNFRRRQLVGATPPASEFHRRVNLAAASATSTASFSALQQQGDATAAGGEAATNLRASSQRLSASMSALPLLAASTTPPSGAVCTCSRTPSTLQLLFPRMGTKMYQPRRRVSRHTNRCCVQPPRNRGEEEKEDDETAGEYGPAVVSKTEILRRRSEVSRQRSGVGSQPGHSVNLWKSQTLDGFRTGHSLGSQATSNFDVTQALLSSTSSSASISTPSFISTSSSSSSSSSTSSSHRKVSIKIRDGVAAVLGESNGASGSPAAGENSPSQKKSLPGKGVRRKMSRRRSRRTEVEAGLEDGANLDVIDELTKTIFSDGEEEERPEDLDLIEISFF